MAELQNWATMTERISGWYLVPEDVRLEPVRVRVRRGLAWLKSNVSGWETQDYSNVTSVLGANCILTTAAGGQEPALKFFRQIEDEGGLSLHGFNAYSTEDDRFVVAEWRRVLRGEGVTA